MNIDHLKYLIAISKEKTMADAAEKLFVTPQALSMAIKKLEEELKMPLLSRSSTGTTLTENGQWLVKRSEEFFSDIEKRQMEYQSYLNTGEILPYGELDLVINALGIGPTKLADMACRLSLKYPDFTINIKEKTRREIEADVCQERTELGFIYRTMFNGKFIDHIDEDLSFYPLQEGELVIQAAPQIRLAKSKNLSLKKLGGYSFCMYDINAEKRIVELLKIVLGEEIHYCNTNSFSAYKVGVESGKYITASLRMNGEELCINYLPGMKILTLRDNIVIYFGIIRKKTQNMSNNFSFIWNEILKEFGGIMNI